MKRSEEIKNLALSLSKLQGEVQNPKKTKTVTVKGTSKGGKAYSYSYSYATLGDCINAIRASLSKNELSFVQDVSVESVGSVDGKTAIPMVTCITTMFHGSGEWIEFTPYQVSSVDFSPQSIAGAVSYAKRYDLSAVFGLAAEDDTDGNAQGHAEHPEKNREYKLKKTNDSEQLQKSREVYENLQKARDSIKILLDEYDITQYERKASFQKHLGCSIFDCVDLKKMQEYYRYKRNQRLDKTREMLENDSPNSLEKFDKARELRDYATCLELFRNVTKSANEAF